MELQKGKLFIDQMGRQVIVPQEPLRIVSLVPSQTELLYFFGLNQEIIGQTIFCIHPDEMHQIKPRIGGTKKLNLDKIRELKPNLIIGNKEENEQSQIEILMKEFPVWMSDIQNMDDSLEMIIKVGELVNKKEQALRLEQQIKQGFLDLVQTEKRKTCTYLIWRKPWMAAGENTFINDILARLGLENWVKNQNSRYPSLEDDWFKTNKPEIILLSSEPYPFKDIHLQELQNFCPNAQIILVDGEMFSWYGSRLSLAIPYFRTLTDQF